MSEKLNLVAIHSAGKSAAVGELLSAADLHATEAKTLSAGAELLANGDVGALMLTGESAGQELQGLLRDHELLARLPDGVALLDAENTIRWANPAMVHLRERCRAQLLRGAL